MVVVMMTLMLMIKTTIARTGSMLTYMSSCKPDLLMPDASMAHCHSLKPSVRRDSDSDSDLAVGQGPRRTRAPRAACLETLKFLEVFLRLSHEKHS